MANYLGKLLGETQIFTILSELFKLAVLLYSYYSVHCNQLKLQKAAVNNGKLFRQPFGGNTIFTVFSEFFKLAVLLYSDYSVC